MRQFKFRIWDKQDKRFVNNDCGTHCCSNWHLDAFGGSPVDFVSTLGDEPYQFTAQEPCDYWMDGMKLVKEPRYVVQQFTGLLDRHGAEVYEGDVVRVIGEGWPRNSVDYVCFWEGRYILQELDVACHDVELEVIGNKFKNLELLQN